ncbi:hypothetical protein RFI_25682 [Reticulomyxa filosa]|uniref:Uncharacterized protein n=1 Tax=Reticulomyxa filosa TaxID=46433 RepID=X6MCT3_RETFI|nr:hypothetical protein RFI_25682 [Reticulomyxa filosa]|eukprot:ETO11694.1 hypothetical protein RFI_25682 [Reticulomyxa filosa]
MTKQFAYGMLKHQNYYMFSAYSKNVKICSFVEYSIWSTNRVFDGHTSAVICMEYLPFVIKSSSELYLIEGNGGEYDEILCIKFVSLKKKVNDNEQKSKDAQNMIGIVFVDKFLSRFTKFELKSHIN